MRKHKLLFSVFSPSATAAFLTQKAKGRDSKVLSWKASHPAAILAVKVKNVQLTRKSTRRKVNRFFLSQPIIMKKIPRSHKRSKNREMPAEKLVRGGKYS